MICHLDEKVVVIVLLKALFTVGKYGSSHNINDDNFSPTYITLCHNKAAYYFTKWTLLQCNIELCVNRT